MRRLLPVGAAWSRAAASSTSCRTSRLCSNSWLKLPQLGNAAGISVWANQLPFANWKKSRHGAHVVSRLERSNAGTVAAGGGVCTGRDGWLHPATATVTALTHRRRIFMSTPRRGGGLSHVACMAERVAARLWPHAQPGRLAAYWDSVREAPGAG